MQGWIKVHRQLKGHWLYKDSNLLGAWIKILMEANHEPQKVLIQGELIDCDRGQSLNSLYTWANLFGKKWSIQKVRTFFKLLEKDFMIELKGLRKTTRLTVCNYDIYQNIQQTDNRQITHSQQTDNTQITTNKNEKNDNNEKNEKKTYSDEDIEMAKVLFENILELNPNYKPPNLNKWADDFRKMREIDKRTVRQIEYTLEWLRKGDNKDSEFWRSNILSPSKLRKQFDKLIIKMRSSPKPGQKGKEALAKFIKERNLAS